MNQLKNLIIAFASTILSFGASAGAMFDSGDNCEAAAQAGFVEQYYPTKQSKGYGDDRIKGLKLTPAEADGCHLMDTAAGKKWVFLRKGTLGLTKDAQMVMLAECQNTIYESRYIKSKPTPVPSVPTLVTKTEIIRTTVTEEFIYKRVDICDETQTRPTLNPATGKLGCPPKEIHMPVTIVPDITIAPANVVASAQQPVAKADDCPDCHKGFDVTKAVPRGDGFCVIAFREDGDERDHFVRFDTMKDTNVLHGAKVDNVAALWNRRYDLVPIGRANNGVDQAITLPKGHTCKQVLKAIMLPGVLDRVGPRLGLTKACRPVRFA